MNTGRPIKDWDTGGQGGDRDAGGLGSEGVGDRSKDDRDAGGP